MGEATYQLKYRQDWGQAQHLARALLDHVVPKLTEIGFIVPMPASTARARQPVTEVAQALGALSGIPVFPDLLRKASNGKSLKDLQTKEEKIEAQVDKSSLMACTSDTFNSYDLVVSSTKLDNPAITTRVIVGAGLLTGLGEDEIFAAVKEEMLK